MYFTMEQQKKISAVFFKALAEGRRTLFEYEVYEILKQAGLSVPKYLVVEDADELAEDALKNVGDRLVLKVISKDIAHKQKIGGVKVLSNPTAAAVKTAIRHMEAEILSHFADGEKPEISGFLLLEFMEFAHGIGYETLFGIKNDPAFGPVLTVSKGGDDAEFFAKYYDPANLILPPLGDEQALHFVDSLNVSRKYESIGHKEYLGLMAETVSVLSRLAYTYSTIAPDKPAYIITEMDINPFVITEDGRFVAVDGYARFTPSSEMNTAESKVNTQNLDRFFYPNGVAVVGVSSNMEKYSMGREIAHLLHDFGRQDLYLINAKGGTLEFDGKQYPVYQSLSEFERMPDLAIYAAPARFFVDFLKELPPDGPKAVIVISGIPSDMTYSQFKTQVDECLPPSTRIIGPNCVGVFHAPDGKGKGVNSIFLDKERLQILSSSHSNVALITQSGALAITVIDKLKESRLFKTVVSFGNKYDVKITDLVSYFDREPDIGLISIYVEGMDPNEGRSFFELASGIDKPIIVYKSGKTEAGAKAAASHTASMSGSYDVFQAACKQAHVLLAEKIEDFEDYLRIFSLISGKTVKGNRVAGVLNAGFESTVGADELNSLTQAMLSKETLQKLKALDVHGLVDLSTPFLDVTPSSDDKVFASFVEALLMDEGVDCVFVANVPHSNALKSDPKTCHDPDSMANLISKMAAKYQKPIVVSINGGDFYKELTRVFEQGGLPVYSDIRSAVKSLDAFVEYHTDSRKQNISNFYTRKMMEYHRNV